MSKQKRAAVYCRVSAEESAISGLSIPVQEKACVKAAEAQGYEVAEVFKDEGFSAYSDKPRPAYIDMMRRLSEFDAIFVWKLDRFSRNERTTHNAVGDILKAGVGWYSVTEKFDMTTPMGRAAFSVAATFAELWSALTQERVLSAIAEAAEQGRTITKPPFGYTLPAPKATIVPDPQTVHIVQSIFRNYADGKPIMTICQELNAANVQKSRGKSEWVPFNIRYMLGNHTYIGKVRHKQAVYTGRHEAIIDEETWAKCQLRLTSNLRVHPRARNGSLSSLLRCGYCGHNLHAGKSGRGVRFYHCDMNRFATEKHPSVYIRDYIVEGYIWLLVDEMLSEDGEPFYKQSLSLSVQSDGRLDVLKNERRQLEEKIKYNVTASSDAGLAIHLLAELLRPLQSRLADVEAEIAEIMDGPTGTANELLMMQGVAALKAADYESQRSFLSTLFKSVEVFGDRIVFHNILDGIKPLAISRQKFIGNEDKTLVLRVV